MLTLGFNYAVEKDPKYYINDLITDTENAIRHLDTKEKMQHTDTNKGQSSQFRYDSLCFENSIITVLDTQLFITDPIYAATPPPY